MGIRNAAHTFGLAKSTLSRRIHGCREKVGAPTKLSEISETLIVKLILTCSDTGFSLSRGQIFYIIENYLKETDQSYIFKDGWPLQEWYYAFVKRHKELSLRYSTNMPANRAMAADSQQF